MHRDFVEEKRESPIIPSARRSIHSHRDNEMVRYGLHISSDKNHRRTSLGMEKEQGADEVDNVMSKMAQRTSPLVTRKDMIMRTNSYTDDDINVDDSTKVLSQSLPSALLSRSHETEDSDTEDEQTCSRSSAPKTRFVDSNHSSDLSWGHSSFDNIENSQYQRFISTNSTLPGTVKSQSKSNMLQICVIILISAVVGIIAAFPTITELLENDNPQKLLTQKVSYDEDLFEIEMNNIQSKYNIDYSSILKLKSGISTISSRMDTGSFIFVYNSKSHDFSPTLFDKFINDVAYTAARYLRKGSSIKQTVILSKNLDMKDHDELIDRYRDEVDKTGVLVVKDVDSVPSNLAMAFHYYCDEYNPLVKRSAIFFTLDIANCSVSHRGSSIHDFIEKCLSARWSTVPAENLKPLLTRMVNVIIDVRSAF